MSTERPSYFAGIDIGSTTFKIVVVDRNGDILFSNYKRHNTDIRNAALEAYRGVFEALGDCDLKMTLTGSVGMGYAEASGMDFVQEVVASAELIKAKFPEIRTFIDIGGEDSKMIFFEDHKSPDMRMNGSCAGGTGAFIDQTAAILNVETKELDTLASTAETIYPIASRCGVFSRTDIQNLVSRNVSKNDVAASVFNAVAIQVISSLSRGTDIMPKVFFCGGPFAFLPQLKKAFVNQLKLNEEDCVLSENAQFVPAWGSALISLKNDLPSQTLSTMISSIENDSGKLFNVTSRRLPALFRSQEEFEKWKTKKGCRAVGKTSWEQLKDTDCFLGVDSGSTTTKIVLIDKKQNVVFQDYSRNNGDSFTAFWEGLKRLRDEARKNGREIRIIGSATTGYGENLIKTAFGLHRGIIETIAHYMAARKIVPDVSFILDIGGQDMKAVFIENGIIKRLEINEACSSGCGSFIENFANMLNYPVAEFAQMSCFAKNPCDLGTRCTVFMNSKVKQAMREGAEVEDIAAGFSYSVVKNCLFKVLKLKDVKELGKNIVVQGGTFRNLSIVRALEMQTGVDVVYSDIPEMMGAYGAALYALENHSENDNPITLDQLVESREYSSHFEVCPGCENKCTVKIFQFANGNKFYSGNNCEKVFSNKSESSRKGINQHHERYRMLFDREKVKNPVMKIGIPRGLGMYENYPFWHKMFTYCNIQPVLSRPSTNKLYEKGIHSIMSDNICFPAKLMHGHIMDLIERGVDRIFYPYAIYENKEDGTSSNSYNCPVVAGYSDVIISSMDPLHNYGIPVDNPTTSFNNNKLLKKSCVEYLVSLGVKKKIAAEAFEEALQEQHRYVVTLAEQNRHIVEKAKRENRMVIMLAGRPYHIDPLIQHKISDCITDMGIDVITENITLMSGDDVFSEINAISQWAYPNRVFKAAKYVANSTENIYFVQLTSFGCGPDAFIIDEISDVLKRSGKSLTLLKIDDVNNIGSLRLRIRSLVESLRFSHTRASYQPPVKLPVFTEQERHRTILAPYFAEGYSEFLPAIFDLMGYKLVNLPMGDIEAAETGLKYSNNEVCYPATIVIGSIIKALESGKYNLDEVAVAMTQTGGQCRATNYLALIKDALISAGYNLPVISVAFGSDMLNEQPGFKMKLKGNVAIAVYTLLYADCISRLYYSSVVREKEKGIAKKLRYKYIDKALPFIANRDRKALLRLFKEAVAEYRTVIDEKVKAPIMGVVGEIYVKYNSFSHKNVLEWLSEQGVEVVAPSMYNFFANSFVNKHINRKNYVKEEDTPLFISDMIYRILQACVRRFDKIGSKFPFYQPFADIFHDAKLASNIINLSANFGEGWLIPAELASFAERGINNVVSLQPFGCIANHVISKGVEKRVKKIYPKMNLLFLDFDSSTSDANVFNRLHFMVDNAKKEL
ncbi:MAG: 2-hydroxyacyl-CoA dehydratase [Bacteroidales bacterium]|nr:2-hydroxyacyl-CoA dehydratase [Bacteroidales bacterium]